MKDMSKAALIKEMLDSAEKSIRSARRLLTEASGDASLDSILMEEKVKELSSPQHTSEGRVIEGIFDGEKMMDTEQNTYPVPANYASKSKLVAGDRLKLTITENGRFIFKQIGPAERKSLVGPLTYEDGQYKVLAGGRAYKVLLASVTFFRAEVGDEITIMVPLENDSEWGAIEAVLPEINKENNEE
ncbi:MAG: hypothetical protein N4A36_02380 [Candidatus Gracilibacteria bacterium]|jgi:hypothetical protein|nr:hypothetical protein [Candidatus Gracilibacteria bacterium]